MADQVTERMELDGLDWTGKDPDLDLEFSPKCVVDDDLDVVTFPNPADDKVGTEDKDDGLDKDQGCDLDLDHSPGCVVEVDLAVVIPPNPADDKVGKDDKDYGLDMSQGCDLDFDPKGDHDRHLWKEDSAETDKVMKDLVSKGNLDLGPEGDPSHGIVCVEHGWCCDLYPNWTRLSLMDVTPNWDG